MLFFWNGRHSVIRRPQGQRGHCVHGGAGCPGCSGLKIQPADSKWQREHGNDPRPERLVTVTTQDTADEIHEMLVTG